LEHIFLFVKYLPKKPFYRKDAKVAKVLFKKIFACFATLR
jgi:hypothetical protein